MVSNVKKFNKPYQLSSQPIPSCGDDDLLIKIHAAGFCHSDLQVWEGQFQARLPMIPSHEPAGEIVQVGSKVKGSWKTGDRVGVLNFKKACGDCVGCRQYVRRKGQTDPRFCEKREMAGFKHDGAFAEYMVADPAVRKVILIDGLLTDRFRCLDYCSFTRGCILRTRCSAHVRRRKSAIFIS